MPASKSVTALTQVAARAVAEKLGTDMIALDLSDQMVLSEVFLIATGGNEEWVLLDYSDLVVHIQSTTLRNYYMLDRLWNDCPRIELDIVREEIAK